MEAAIYSNEFSISSTKDSVIFEFYYKDPKIGDNATSERVLIKTLAIERSLAKLLVSQLNMLIQKGEEPPGTGKSRI